MKTTSTIKLYIFLLFISIIHQGFAQKIDRKALVTRHNVVVTSVDTLASLTVGNGKFAFTTDITGLQTFPDYYQGGIALGTQSEWGWDSNKNPNSYTFEETLKDYDQYGRKVSYSVQIKTPKRNNDAVNWFRENPHRIQLGNIGFEITKKNGELISPKDLTDMNQELNLWTGIITSSFSVEGVPVKVETLSHHDEDLIAVKVTSDLINKGQLKIRYRIPYPSNNWKDTGVNWNGSENYTSTLKSINPKKALVTHKMDSLTYHTYFQWKEKSASITEKEEHYFIISPTENNFSFTCKFTPENKNQNISNFDKAVTNSEENWKDFWLSGGAIDFSSCTDPRAFEIERRVVLSQYLTKLQCTSNQPPQETGLTYNSWYGKPHLEMHWWHGVHFALWNRSDLLKNAMQWYDKASGKAFEIAKRQGFDGLRWQKMTDPYGNESPSSVGSFLIWQQPHYITFAELFYQENPSKDILNTYKDNVYATADFMASFANYNEEKNRYELGPGVIAAQERFKATETYNPTYELNYWYWGLKTAIEWKQRLGETPPKKWIEVMNNLSDLPILNDVYLATESAQDSYTNPVFKTDHPSVLGTLGMLPLTKKVDLDIMKNTFNLVWTDWTWEDTWGWDFPMTAMTATRLHMPEKAVEALLMDIRTNTYLPNGHNFQDERLTLYLPGNGGVLTAVALMCAGWDGNTVKNPGFPKDGNWDVKWEGLQKMF
ncbi:hypothetical protein JoomaDRAFT_2291 [Galbibacter orientalis DSM 19592]|uniref:Glycoside hydrolase family 65 n=1 Tax=Galbibacter orientalis DSM 19592 TaxID=926559 RepID=I3C6N6_9FLAO|nr:hypothetical protein [Galbibacter orientalis]EIJ39279.1 hypothetical protein JoomaDRAFT_2291 [Galbibacter orientalis DSM 19592]